ncbi:putative SP-containing membrane protein [Vairimorpha necatrix]|uniref:SP-containing membrane protein n=1 Tax=Vairimorpha necatrix TaxID=6039 RepID=A0AAX4JB72_9MICR
MNAALILIQLLLIIKTSGVYNNTEFCNSLDNFKKAPLFDKKLVHQILIKIWKLVLKKKNSIHNARFDTSETKLQHVYLLKGMKALNLGDDVGKISRIKMSKSEIRFIDDVIEIAKSFFKGGPVCDPSIFNKPGNHDDGLEKFINKYVCFIINKDGSLSVVFKLCPGLEPYYGLCFNEKEDSYVEGIHEFHTNQIKHNYCLTHNSSKDELVNNKTNYTSNIIAGIIALVIFVIGVFCYFFLKNWKNYKSVNLDDKQKKHSEIP